MEVNRQNRGSESCPIDLSDDELPQKEPGMSAAVQAMHTRLTVIENKLSECIDKKEPTASSSEQALSLSSRCQSLENRLSVLENFLVNMGQSFPSFSMDPCSIVKHGETTMIRETKTIQNESEIFGVGSTSDIAYEIDAREALAVPCNGSATTDEDTECASICSDETILICQDMTHTSGETTVLDNNPGSCSDQAGLAGLNDCVPADAENNSGCLNKEVQGEEKTECPINRADDRVDIKPFSLSKFISVKKELNLMRDEQGRVLIFLCCAAKRMNNTSNMIVAVSGMYLHDQLHEEYVFTSQQCMKDVKVEAEIRAAYFGVEIVKDLFRESLGDVCVMVISSCSQLVQSMKARKSYPGFLSCTCLFRDCEHSELRWSSQETLGKSQVGILPDLILSMMTLRVHWCKVENISQEEKNVLDQYRNVVDTVLSEAIQQNRKNNCLPSSDIL